MKPNDTYTISQLMDKFSDVIANVGDVSVNLDIADQNYRNLRESCSDLHHIWIAMLDLVADAYTSTDLVVIR